MDRHGGVATVHFLEGLREAGCAQDPGSEEGVGILLRLYLVQEVTAGRCRSLIGTQGDGPLGDEHSVLPGPQPHRREVDHYAGIVGGEGHVRSVDPCRGAVGAHRYVHQKPVVLAVQHQDHPVPLVGTRIGEGPPDLGVDR